MRHVGIWDCLSSQQVVNIVRRWVAEGKELGEICEQICEHCLAPDTTSGAGVGCDNMTILIVAFLHGKTKEEWYAWIKDRVERKYGYDTPEEIPQLFAQSRLLAFRARRQALAEREQNNSDSRENGAGGNLGGFLSAGGLGNFARVLGSTGGITFHPSSGIMSDSGLMFEKYDDSDEEDTDEDMDTEATGNEGRSFFSETFGVGAGDGTKSLREQLADLEKDSDSDMNEEEASGVGTFSASGQPQDSPVAPNTHTPTAIGNTDHVLQGEAPPPPPSALPNGASTQLKSEPGGDKAHPAVEADGLMDKSEGPIKAST
jgi:protein phosphatase PTC2/3